ncbi:MAG: transporter permease, partial [Proteobacteria bacterium]|nr:transporter permease [Pseudomonadota bacterium]
IIVNGLWRSYYEVEFYFIIPKGDKMRIHRLALAAAVVAGISGSAVVQAADLKIAHIIGRTGPMEPFATQASRGFKLGLEYATGGKMEVAGRKIVVLDKDDQLKPDNGKQLLQAAFKDEGVDIAVGPTSSAVALAMIQVARENKKILIIDQAAAENLTGNKGSRYVFRTGRNSDHDAYANAAVYAKPGNFIATLAPDYSFGREGIASFKQALKGSPAQLVEEVYAPANNADFTPQATKLFNALKDKPGRKIIWYIWAGAGNPLKIMDLDPKRYGIEVISGGGTVLPFMGAARPMVGNESATAYYFKCPKNAINDWMVKEHQKRYNSPPDFFTVNGFMTAQAIVEAVKKTNGKTDDTELLIKTLKGLAFDSPKGKVFFNKDNNQLMQVMYHFKYKLNPEMDNSPTKGVDLDCIREIPISEMKIPAMVLKD